jgi:S1-C subfamily serine protease
MELIPGTPASRAGLAVDDIILRYDDHPLDTVDALVKHVRVSKVGHIAKLLVERDGQRVTLLLPVVERPDDAMARAEPAPQWPP